MSSPFDAVPRPPPTPTPTPSIRDRTLPLLADAYRIAFFRRLPPGRPGASWVRILVAAFMVAMPSTLAWVAITATVGAADADNLPEALYIAALVLLGGMAAGAAARQTADMPSILLAGMLGAFAIESIYVVPWLAFGADMSDEAFAVFASLPCIWLGLAIARYVLTRPGVPPGRAVWVIAAVLGFVTAPMIAADFSPSVWQPVQGRQAPAAEAEVRIAARRAAASEDTIYRQPEIFEREMASLAPGRPGVIDVYYVGVAGDAEQDVFRREVDAVGQLMRERFDAEGRAIQLVNSPNTLETHPIASVTSLRAALKRVGDAMNPGEDVLVLFLTSHGDEKHRFQLQLRPWRFHELTPQVLRSALDESGIANRVVIVSACYSGGFVDPLRDARTLVISAAAHDKTSFGCDDREAWTYFGKAYFDEALRTTYSFRDAFERARAAVEAREKAEKFDASDPRMAMGESIRETLATLERELPSRARQVPLKP